MDENVSVSCDKEKMLKSKAAGLIVAIIVILATVGRLIMSMTLHMWFTYTQIADDWLLMSYSLPWYRESVDMYKMAKNQGFAFWLSLVHASGLNVDIMYYLLWVVSACVVAYGIYRFFFNTYLSIFSYLYVLWNPLAFENWSGTRVYRNSVFAPSMFILIGLMMVFMSAFSSYSSSNAGERKTAVRNCLGFGIVSILLGLTFVFIYDLKEDSIWLVPMYVFIVVAKLISVLRNAEYGTMRKVGVAILCLLPLGVSFSGVQVIKYENRKYFGVYSLNTRTDGEIAKFISNIYQIDSPNQNPTIWTPVDSIESAFDASPTLRAMPDLLHYVEYEGYAAPDIHQHPLTGDFISWQLLQAIDSTIGMNDESRVQQIFKQANNEIDYAFSTGKLKRTNKITLTKSLVPRTGSQIASLIPQSIKHYGNVLFLISLYKVSINQNESVDYDEPSSWIGLQRLNIDINDSNPSVFSWFSAQQARFIANTDRRIYSGLNIALFIVLLYAFTISIVRTMKEKRLDIWRHLWISGALLVYAFAYTLFACWYAEYLANAYITYFYVAGLIMPLMYVALLIATGSLLNNRKLPIM